ncbi:unnamed protein product [Gongylonema pulchrum]|uniref:NR LBD domain-containing protein n=1 Tax=Gongylonema pulchrum TaxID=637853 RepID=A0A183D9S8_9BILA|nr:unnamed protein product [Gongylonema pulchrum]
MQIPDSYCICERKWTPIGGEEARIAALVLIRHINQFLRRKNLGDRCATLTLKKLCVMATGVTKITCVTRMIGDNELMLVMLLKRGHMAGAAGKSYKWRRVTYNSCAARFPFINTIR